MNLPFSVALATSLLALPLAGTELTGKVTTLAGVPIEHAELTLLPAEQRTYSKADGGFSIDGCTSACSLWIRHPRFEERVLQIVEPNLQLSITLTAKQEVFEHIEVTASRVGDAITPSSVATSVIQAGDRTIPPTTLTELVEATAGIAENGQGGLFQVYSIRGVSRHRVMTLIDGMPVTSERRAGVSASFIDPLLLDSAEVVRGPASTYYGSGALGGVVQAFARRFDVAEVQLGYSSFGHQAYQLFGTGDQSDPGRGWSVSLAHRRQDDDQAIDGTLQNSHFEQTSGVLTKSWTSNTRRYEVLVIPTLGRDIGKPNADFPAREINYPRERHFLVKLDFASSGPWSSSAFVHPNDLETTEDRSGARRSIVGNSSIDFGAKMQRRFDNGRWLLAIDYWGRRSVNADEQRFDGNGPSTVSTSLEDGELDELAVLSSTSWNWARARIQAGGRATWQHQGQRGAADRDDSSLNGFVGAVIPIGTSFELTSNLGTGLRFPTLSERFFTGTTGRGQVIGNPNLEAESSFAIDAGLRWFSRRDHIGVQVFRQHISDYIERVEVEPGLLTFANLISGTIGGVEIEGHHRLAEDWHLSWTGQLIEGKDEDGNALADIPTDRLRSQLSYTRGPWSLRFDAQYRRAKTDPGSGEKELSAATILGSSLRYHWNDRWSFDVRAENIGDELYFSSADELTSPAAGRGFGLGLSWRPRSNAPKPEAPGRPVEKRRTRSIRDTRPL